jgi:integrase
VADVVHAFLSDVETRGKVNTVRVYRYFLLPFAERHATVPAGDLTPVAVERWARQPAWGDTTRAQFLAAVVAAFRFAVRAKLIHSNPLAGVHKPPRRSRGADCLITPEEHAALVAAASATFRDVLTVLHATGCRPGEAARTTAGDFDATAGTVTLWEHKTAGTTGRPRVVYLTPDCVALLRRLADRHTTGPLLRTVHGNRWTKTALVRAMDATRKRAGVIHATCYSYRHTLATDSLAAGVPDAIVAELLGNTPATIHRHYNHISKHATVLRDAARRVRG